MAKKEYPPKRLTREAKRKRIILIKLPWIVIDIQNIITHICDPTNQSLRILLLLFLGGSFLIGWDIRDESKSILVIVMSWICCISLSLVVLYNGFGIMIYALMINGILGIAILSISTYKKYHNCKR